MFILKILARELMLPPAFQLILMALGFLLLWRRRRLGWTLVVVGFVSLTALCIPALAERLIGSAERYPALDPNKPVAAQAVVVLGGGGGRLLAPEFGGAISESASLERVMLAAFLARRFGLPVAISGSTVDAATMSQTLSRNFGISARWIDDRSRDTYENARLSAFLLQPAGIKRIVLVTSSTHEWRAVQEFTAAGFQVIPAPVGLQRARDIFRYVPSPSGLAKSHDALYELIGEPIRRLLALLGLRERLDRNLPRSGVSSSREVS